jgi:hypothetical protein
VRIRLCSPHLPEDRLLRPLKRRASAGHYRKSRKRLQRNLHQFEGDGLRTPIIAETACPAPAWSGNNRPRPPEDGFPAPTGPPATNNARRSRWERIGQAGCRTSCKFACPAHAETFLSRQSIKENLAWGYRISTHPSADSAQRPWRRLTRSVCGRDVGTGTS